MRQTSQRVIINILLIIALSILIISGVLAYKQFKQLIDANKWVDHTHNVIETAYEILTSISEAESRINFYIINRNIKVVADFPALIDEAIHKIKTIKSLTKDNAVQTHNIKQMDSLVNEKIALLQSAYNDITDGKNIDNVIKNTIKRENIKFKLRDFYSIFNQQEQYLLVARNLQFTLDAQRSNMLIITSQFISVFLFVLSILLLNFHLSRLKIAEQKQQGAETELLISNKKLKESDDRFKLATRGSNVGVWDWIPGTDHVYYSPYFLEMLGYKPDEFPQSLDSFNKVIHPEDKDRVWELVNKHLTNHIPFQIEYRLKTKSGEYHWFEAAGKAVWDTQGNATRMAGSIIDISERKNYERIQSIEYSITRVISDSSTIKDASDEIVRIIGEALHWDAGSFWIVNKTTQQLTNTGYWQKSTIENNIFMNQTRDRSLPLGEGLSGTAWKTGKVIWTTHAFQEEHFIRAKEAKIIGIQCALFIPISLHNETVALIELYSCAKNKTKATSVNLIEKIGPQLAQFIERKLIEEELRTSETFKTAVLEAALDSIITTDSRGTILSCNPQTTKIFDYISTDLVGKNIDILLPNILKFIENFIGKVGVEFIAKNKNNQTFPAEITISKMYMKKQYIYVLLIRNITERKKIDKMKSEFISVVSHELRTPITSIRGSLSLILGGATGTFSQKALKLLEIANNNCDRLLLLINDILDIEKIEAGKMVFQFKVVDISEIIHQAVIANKMFAEKFEVNLNEPTDLPHILVNVDPNRLIQVVTNLISNAVKFSPKGESVDIQVSKQDKKVRVEVIDRGSGIPIEFQKKIFQRFSQADSSDTRNKSGTGLGLNISKMIIEKMDGQLAFRSESNKGSTFYFDLPVWEEKSKAEIKVLPSEDVEQNRLLICEDDQDVARYMGAVLESRGYKVDLAFNVTSARDFLAFHTYKALLLDLILPDEDGISFIRELKNNERNASLPIIVISIISQTGRSLLNGDAFSVVDWLDKPVDFNRLLKAITSIKKDYVMELPRILHVEDDNDTQSIIRTLLEGHGLVITAENLQSAQKILLEQPFDLVILDLLLPDGNGVELIPILAERKVPIIVYSSTELDQQYAKNVYDTLIKSPTSNDKLLLTILRLLKSDEEITDGK